MTRLVAILPSNTMVGYAWQMTEPPTDPEVVGTPAEVMQAIENCHTMTDGAQVAPFERLWVEGKLVQSRGEDDSPAVVITEVLEFGFAHVEVEE